MVQKYILLGKNCTTTDRCKGFAETEIKYVDGFLSASFRLCFGRDDDVVAAARLCFALFGYRMLTIAIHKTKKNHYWMKI